MEVRTVLTGPYGIPVLVADSYQQTKRSVAAGLRGGGRLRLRKNLGTAQWENSIGTHQTYMGRADAQQWL